MTQHRSTYMARTLALRFPKDAARLRQLTEQAGDDSAPLGRRAMALAEIGELLDHHAGHPEMDSPTANLTEAVFVGLAESLCPALVGQLCPLWASGH